MRKVAISILFTYFNKINTEIFGSLRIILYLCKAIRKIALRVKAAAQHSSSKLSSAFTLHFPCTVNQKRKARTQSMKDTESNKQVI